MAELIQLINLADMDSATENFVSKKTQITVFIAVFAAFLLAIILGTFSGISYGQSKATYVGAWNITKALKYFHDDQGSYPTSEQYLNQIILVPLYLSSIPKPDDVSGACSKNPEFYYEQKSQDSFALQFCLKQSVAGFPAGLNLFTEKNIQ